ncbi:MAG TPA: type IV toxin-antitoxin system AbiEi family antitoxin domain-containing protein [Acidimicrobiales bacterium]|nr:type IV toxin-antitoxin system AbiEi family antitoxin domain-containing protein [Acidimicrobiales bacterium]
MSTFLQLDRLAAKQHGLVALDQCRRLGLTQRQILYCIKKGLMARVRPGVYRWCGSPSSWPMMAMAAVLAAGEGAVLSHTSAGVLWGFLSPSDTDDLEITTPRQCRIAGVRAHRHALTIRERATRSGIPVTTVERTLLDLAESTRHRQLGEHIDDALRRRLTAVAKLDAALRAHQGPGRRATSAMKAALADRGAGYYAGANPWEQGMDRLWDESGLPAAVRQHKVRTRHRTYVIDRAIVELKIGVEWNGRADHGTRSGFDYDSDRRADLVEAGWLIIDFTTNSSWARITRTIRKAVEDRRALLLLSA